MRSVTDQIVGLGPRAERPRLNPGADLTAYRLTPVEAFVLSRVDGSLSYEEICFISGLSAEATFEVLRRLKRDKLILGQRDAVPAPARAPNPTPIEMPAFTGVPAPVEDRRGLLERLDDGSAIEAEELRSGPDLNHEIKVRIARMHHRLKRLSPHELLGLPKDANRSAVKRAYFAAAKELHPDRYYGKDIGDFREKLGDIFARVTEAFQSLYETKK